MAVRLRIFQLDICQRIVSEQFFLRTHSSRYRIVDIAFKENRLRAQDPQSSDDQGKGKDDAGRRAK